MHKRSRLQTAMLITLLVLTALATAHSLFVGLEIDEQYALSLSYRLLRGDRLLYTMWEPHQFSALPLVPLLALFMAVTGGTTGIVLFVRIVTLLVRGALAFWAWRLLRRNMYEPFALLFSAVLALYMPKWFFGPDYTGQQYLFTLAALLCLCSYYAGRNHMRRPWLVVLGAVCACGSYLAYPQSVFAVIPLVIGLWVLGRKSGEALVFGAVPRGVLLFVGTCAVCGAAVLAWVLTGLPADLLLPRLQMLLGDPQYAFSLGDRLALLAQQVRPILRFLGAPVALAMLLGVAHSFATQRRRGKYTAWMALDNFFIDVSVLSLLWCTVYAAREGNIDMRHFVPALVVTGGWVFWADRKEAAGRRMRAVLFWLGYVPGLVTYVCIFRSTLLGLAPTFMYLTMPALCGMAALALRPSHELRHPRHRPDGSGAGTVLSLFLLFLALTRIFAVQVTGWKEHDVFDTPLRLISAGPAAGIWADVEAADMQQALSEALAEARPGDELLLCMAYPQGTAYLMADGTLKVGQASVISGSDYDPRFAAYYEEFPEKLPDIILYDNHNARDAAGFAAWLDALTAQLTVADRQTVTVGTASLDVLRVEK